jgi:hypothetical protein
VLYTHVWDYSKIDENALREALVNTAWDEVFYNVDDVDELYNRWLYNKYNSYTIAFSSYS